jgi:hypothetical protein
LIHRRLQIVLFAVDGEKYLIQVPCVAKPGTPHLIGVLLAELPVPLADGFIRDNHRTMEAALWGL